jgi:hypothetical protein
MCEKSQWNPFENLIDTNKKIFFKKEETIPKTKGVRGILAMFVF